MAGLSIAQGSVMLNDRLYIQPRSMAPTRAAEASQPSLPRAYAAQARQLAPERLSYSSADTPLPTVEELNNAPDNLAKLMIRFPGHESEIDFDFPGMSKEDEAALGLRPTDPANPTGECQTCKQRKYQDGSDDPGVSFKSPTRMDPDTAATAVRGHEQEHVVRERAVAQREGRKVISQSVSIHMDICPECGRVYVSGGLTRTVTASDDSSASSDTPSGEAGSSGEGAS